MRLNLWQRRYDLIWQTPMQHLYISYPAHDETLIRRLVEDLQAAGYAVFVDAVSEIGTIAWASETRRAIRTCGAMIMVLDLAGRRRIGIRHEGILANRRKKPVFVLARSHGDLPRYLTRATVIDFAGEYDPGLQQLLAALPPASVLLNAPVALPRRRNIVRANRALRRRRILWAMGLLSLILLCVILGIVFGIIPV
jgi:hypothetical protein